MLRSSVRILSPLSRTPLYSTSLYSIPRVSPISFPRAPILRRCASTSTTPTQHTKRSWIIPVAATFAVALYTIYKTTETELASPAPPSSAPTPPSTPSSSQWDTQELYKSKSTGDIAFSWFILKLCSYDTIVEYGPRLLQWAESHYVTRGPARWVMKYTFFKHFVAGETQEETTEVVDHLKKVGLGIVLDYSIEAGSGSKDELDKVAQDIASTVHIAARNPSLAFACVKVSGLTSFALLERFSQIVTYYNNNPKAMPIQWEENDTDRKTVKFDYTQRVLPSAAPIPTAPSPLSASEKQELNYLMARMDLICNEAHKSNVPVLIDAEQTYYQPAIDYMTLYLCKKFNKKSAIVFNTYQMYLNNGPSRLLNDITQAKRDNYVLGVKLVRGAYMHTERKRAIEMSYADPISKDISTTHANYAAGLLLAFDNIPHISLMIATHNEDTVVDTLNRLKKLKIDPQSRHLQFAQLYGMGDHLSFLLLQNGYRVFKYVPYGPIEQVIPYLVRRMQENRGFIGSASETERSLLWKEFKRRFGL